jgi:Ca2+/H+ antiporter, TMEM165/GDT1 family
MAWWTTNASAIAIAFSASFLEVVEAFTIVLAVVAVRGAWPALLGAVAALICLAVIVLIFGSALNRVPAAGARPGP